MVAEYVVDAQRYVPEEGTTLTRSMLCSPSICLASRLLFRYFINTCSVKNIFQESKRGTILSSCHAYHLITQRSFTILSFLVKPVYSTEFYLLSGKFKA